MKDNSQLSSYIVSFETLALLPLVVGTKVFTRVIERSNEVIVTRRPAYIVRKSCEFYGSTLKHRIETARQTLGNRHKTPILLAHAFDMPYIFLPTLSPTSDHNIWISYHAIEGFKECNEHYGCVVQLENNTSIPLNVTMTTMYRQHSFATLLKKDFLKKQNLLNKTSYLLSSKNQIIFPSS